MKRVLIITLAVSLLIGASAMASDTRVWTMGDNNMVLLDEANIWLFPSRVFDYPNQAVAEMWDEDFTQFGIHWKFGSDNPWVLGTYFTDYGTVYPEIWVPFDWWLLENQRIDLFYGNQISDMNFGMHVSYLKSGQEADWEDPDDTSSYNFSKESFSYYDFTFGITPKTGKWDVTLNFGFGSWTDEDYTGETETEPDGYSNMGILGRYLWQYSPDYTFIPHAGLMYAKHGIKNHVWWDGDPLTEDDLIEKQTITGFDLGFGLNYTPSAKVLAVCDFGFQYMKYKYEYERILPDEYAYDYSYKYMALPYFKIGLDADVFSWMDVRFGATSFWTNASEEWEDEDDFEKYKWNWADNDTYLGLGFHWNRLHVDTEVDPELFLDGFNFISGEENEMNFRITAVYKM